MRWACAGVLGSLLAGLTLAHAEDQFPYTGYINASNVNVRCEPGRDHAPTGTVGRGTPVEVYRHDPGGWYAIRPPQGSFSWIQARHLRMTEQPAIAEVIDDGVTVWAGTDSSDARLAWQVRLDKGELVELIGSKRLSGEADGAAQTWYMISPPAGEFRWVYGKYVDRVPVAAGASGGPAPALGAAPPASGGFSFAGLGAAPSDAHAAPLPLEVTDAAALPSDQDIASVDSATAAAGAAQVVQTSGWTIRAAEPVSALVGSNVSSASTASAATAPTFVPAGATAARGTSLEDDLAAIDLDLSMMVTRKQHQWDLTTLRARTQEIIDQGQTAVIRGRARLLMDKIARCEEIKKLYDQIDAVPRSAAATPDALAPAPSATNLTAAAPPASTAPAATLATASSAVAPSPAALPAGTAPAAAPAAAAADPIGTGVRDAEPPNPLEPRYDGSGWLMPLVPSGDAKSRERNVPPFALMDDDGNILQLVTPAPGLNLRRYVRQQVGVYGQRNFLPSLNAGHVTAQRIIPLDRVRR